MTTLQQIAELLKTLNLPELRAIYDYTWDLKYALQKVEDEKMKELLK